jgi:hypothetical protein
MMNGTLRVNNIMDGHGMPCPYVKLNADEEEIKEKD